MNYVLSVLGISAFLFFGCVRKQQQPQYIAKVGDEMLLEKNVEELKSDYELRSYVTAWVNESLLFQEAKKNDVDSDEEFQEQVRTFRRQLLIQRLLEKEVYLASDTIMSEENLLTYFNTHREEFIGIENQVFLSGIVFRLRNEANTFRNKILRGNSWETQIELSKNSSDGLMEIFENRFFTKQTIPTQEMWNVAFSMKVETISFPVPFGEGFVIIRLNGLLRKGERSPFHFVRDEIRQRILIEIRRSRYEEFLLRLKEKYSVDVPITNVPSEK